MKYQPYPKYKDSGVDWIGEIPEGWKVLRFKEFIAERDERSSEGTETLLSVSAYTGVSPRSEIIDADDTLVRAETLEGYRIVHPNDLVMNIMLAWSKGLGVSSVFGITSPAYAVFRFSSGVAGYFHYLLRSDMYSTYFKAFSTGVIDSRLRLYPEKFLALSTPWPSESLQSAITAFLDRETAKVDTLVRDYEDLITLLTEKRQAFISHAVTRGLSELVDAADPEFGEWCKPVRFRDSGVEWLGEIPERWLASRVKVACAFLTSGPRGWSEQVSDSGILFAQSGDLDGNLGLDFHEMKRVQVIIDAEANRSQLRNGDVVVCITGAKTGNVSVCHGLEEPAFINQHLCLLRPRHSVHPTFLGLALSSDLGRNQFTASQYGLKQGLGLADVANTWIALPDSAYQSAIVAFLTRETTKMDALVRETQDAIELLKEHRSALITAAVTGKINVEGLE